MTWSINCDGTFLFLRSASVANVKKLHFRENGPAFKSVLTISKEIHYNFRTTLSRPWNGFSFTQKGILPKKLISPTAQLPPPTIIGQKVLFWSPAQAILVPCTDKQTQHTGGCFFSLNEICYLPTCFAGRGQYKQPYILHNLWHWSKPILIFWLTSDWHRHIVWMC